MQRLLTGSITPTDLYKHALHGDVFTCQTKRFSLMSKLAKNSTSLEEIDIGKASGNFGYWHRLFIEPKLYVTDRLAFIFRLLN